ncbi:hypothetical protein MicloDRAFT_00004050 [Microvirga lotononidis]|uniref:Uncharacterized protein n=1 Tax=Microvirga lotononidis TaxID=864069 RepID=I4Z1S0_9HYPH|nr:hypothetical protein MicloDRAFT_00014830 [Microvirga lotononidis]EIM30878.1 hypothetical protein MicloDRAFT_00004050 [Microvirga lotononidis]
MPGPGHNRHVLLAGELLKWFLVQIDHPMIVAANNQERWRPDPRQRCARQIRAAAAPVLAPK